MGGGGISDLKIFVANFFAFEWISGKNCKKFPEKFLRRRASLSPQQMSFWAFQEVSYHSVPFWANCHHLGPLTHYEPKFESYWTIGLWTNILVSVNHYRHSELFWATFGPFRQNLFWGKYFKRLISSCMIEVQAFWLKQIGVEICKVNAVILWSFQSGTQAISDLLCIIIMGAETQDLFVWLPEAEYLP